uniref:Beta-defensin n=1 Tax=Rhinolophus ferrumequinum TaxID=59479 RepID=A0A671FU04_RHIFE
MILQDTVHLPLLLLAVRSGLNRYIKSLFSTCWQLKGVCKKTCARKEEYHIFCNAGLLCCVDKKHLPIRTGK